MIVRRLILWTTLVVLALVVVAACVLFARQGGFAPFRVPTGTGPPVANDATTLARGEYLVRLGDCAACHTTRGGVAFAGGHAFDTDYGTLYSSNLTPDREKGLGDWSADEFRHAMRYGVSRRGPLYPVFPYEHFARLTDADIDAIYAYLRALVPSANTPPANRLAFPANSRSALIVWRMLSYRPAAPMSATDRGQYLVEGIGHCAMCHSTRAAGDSVPSKGYLAGGILVGSGWYAPPLDADSLRRYSSSELADFLRTGTSPHGTVYGPMAEVVYSSLRALTAADAASMADYLKRIPPHAPPDMRLSARERFGGNSGDFGNNGAEIFKRACAECHGDNGEGKGGHYPALTNAVATRAPTPINAVRIVLYGAMPPTTPGNPRPYSMPPFAQQLSSAEIAAVVNYIRRNEPQASRVAASDVEAMAGIVLD